MPGASRLNSLPLQRRTVQPKIPKALIVERTAETDLHEHGMKRVNMDMAAFYPRPFGVLQSDNKMKDGGSIHRRGLADALTQETFTWLHAKQQSRIARQDQI